MKPDIRKRIYGILLASAPLVVAYGLATEQQVTLWIAFASAALGLAFNNVPPKE